MAAAVLAVVTLLAGCTSGRAANPSAQLSSWVHSSQLGQMVGAVLDDAGHVARAERGHDASLLHTVCAVLLGDAGQANSKLPSPDASVTKLLSAGYASLGRSANDCYDAGTGDTRLAARAAAERAKGVRYLRQALERVERVTGRTVPTTTTTQPYTGGIFG